MITVASSRVDLLWRKLACESKWCLIHVHCIARNTFKNFTRVSVCHNLKFCFWYIPFVTVQNNLLSPRKYEQRRLSLHLGESCLERCYTLYQIKRLDFLFFFGNKQTHNYARAGKLTEDIFCGLYLFFPLVP